MPVSFFNWGVFPSVMTLRRGSSRFPGEILILGAMKRILEVRRSVAWLGYRLASTERWANFQNWPESERTVSLHGLKEFTFTNTTLLWSSKNNSINCT